MIDPYVILAMLLNFILSSTIKFILPKFVSFLGKEGCCVWGAVDISVHQSL